MAAAQIAVGKRRGIKAKAGSYELFHAQQLYASLALREKIEITRRLKMVLLLVREPT